MDYLENVVIEQGLVSFDNIERVRPFVSEEKPLADVLVENGMIGEDKVLELLSSFFGITYVNLNFYSPDEESLSLVSGDLCLKFKAVPLFKIRNTLIVTTVDPSNVNAMDEIRVMAGMGVEPILALGSSIQKCIEKHYKLYDTVTDVIDTMKAEEAADLRAQEISMRYDQYHKMYQDVLDDSIDEPIVKIVNLFISQAVRDKASDIHINPEKDCIRVRYRIDGVLHEIGQPPKKFQSAIISRIKILANLDIAERRLPQDGRIEIKVDNRSIDLRVSSLPTIYGENIVMRVLDKGSVLIGLDDLGFSEHDFKCFERIVKKPHGMLLTSGPTGSGKTTTLYSALGLINSLDMNIMTLEDPVEYNLPLIRQSQINPKTGYTFANGLRSILRQDPDVILVGEIRDTETAQIAVQSAMTGHFVLSTLHTNDATGVITRLARMGLPEFLIASTLVAAIGQRLVRVICSKCKEEIKPSKEILEELEMSCSDDSRFFKGKGCDACLGTGYKGRLGLYEFLEIDSDIQEAIVKKVPETELRKIARKSGMRTMREDGVYKIKKGLTTIEEVLRVTGN